MTILPPGSHHLLTVLWVGPSEMTYMPSTANTDLYYAFVNIIYFTIFNILRTQCLKGNIVIQYVNTRNEDLKQTTGGSTRDQLINKDIQWNLYFQTSSDMRQKCMIPKYIC